MKEKVVEYTKFKRSILSRYVALQEVYGFTWKYWFGTMLNVKVTCMISHNFIMPWYAC